MSARTVLSRVRALIGGRLPDQRPDTGATLMEVMAAMTLLSIFLGVFTASIIQIFRVSNRVNATIDSSNVLNIVFAKLDKQVRYASQIDTQTPAVPTNATTTYWVEYLNTSTDTCYQLKLDNTARTLSERIWSPASATIFPSYTVLATNVSVPTGNQPFTLLPTGDGVHYKQRLAFSVAATAGPVNTTTTSQLSVTFTALNSGTASATSTVCAGGEHS